MIVLPTDIDVQLTGDNMIDVVVLQWWTALEHGPRCFSPLPTTELVRKTAEFERLAAWLRDEFAAATPTRPLFIVAPEVSFPHSLLAAAETLTQSLQRPCVFIAGLSHLTWHDYTTLLAQCPGMPANIDWCQGGDAGKFVNAAAIFIHAGATRDPVGKYLQLKSHPYSGEAPQLFCGSHTFLFRSRDQVSGSRFNFAVKICSDFVSPDAVREFRRAVATSAPGAHLDLTFVLQYQDAPNAIQFKQGVQAYFEPPNRMVETATGAVLFVNNSNALQGRRPQFGGSRLGVGFAQLFRMAPDMACPTCVRDDQGPFGYQALILRESGPCIYRLAFKPIYLVDRTPGHGGDFPFHPGECAFLDGNGRGLTFLPIPPICHWIESEWREDESDLLATITGDGGEGAATYQTFVLQAHQSMRALWISAMGTREVEVRDGIQNYTSIVSTQPNSPMQQAEPWLWNPTVSTSVRRFMRVLALTKLGLGTVTDLRFPAGLRLRHAMIGDVKALTLLWGNGDRDLNQLLGCFHNLKKRYGLGEFVGPKWMLVLVDLGVPFTAADLEAWTDPDITHGTVMNQAGDPIPAVGNVARVEQELEVMAGSDLTSALMACRDQVALESRLRTIMEPRLT